MPNFIVSILMFGLGALWMRYKCAKIYNDEVWKAKRKLELEKIALQMEKVRAAISNLLDEQINGKKT